MGRGKKFQQVFIATQRQNQYAMEASIAQAELNNIRNQRAAIVDPSSAVKDLSGTFSNPYANLGVATKAAEMQVEQTDAALANTLDTIRATGSGAGGATALAQAALQSKNSVSASIQQQEAQNQKLKAQGEQQLQQMVASEQQRVQAAKAAGMEFVFSAEEARTNAAENNLMLFLEEKQEIIRKELPQYMIINNKRIKWDTEVSQEKANLGVQHSHNKTM